MFDNNKIKSLPEDVGNLENLTSLTFRNNYIEKIPYSLSMNKNLETLSFHGNRISSIDTICRLTKLQNLECSYNAIKEIPDYIGNLRSLQKLNLAFNIITKLPDSLFDLANLETLFLSGNNLYEINDNIFKLFNMRLLSIASCQLEEISESVYKLEKLETLVLDNNRIRKISENIKNLKNLKLLSVSDNLLSQLPSGIGYIEGLKPKKNKSGRYEATIDFSSNLLPHPYGIIESLVDPNKTEVLLSYLREELDLSYFEGDKFNESAHGSDIPVQPQLEKGPSFRINDGKFDLNIHISDEDKESLNDIVQESVRKRLIKQLAKLYDETKKFGNLYPNLLSNVKDYQEVISFEEQDIDVASLWAVGNALMAQAMAFDKQNTLKTTTEPLEPDHAALLIDVARLHGSYILGFPTGKELTERADHARIQPQIIEEIETPTKSVLAHLSQEKEIVSDRARKLAKSLEDALIVAGWNSARVGHSSYVTVRNFLIEAGRILSIFNDKGGGIVGIAALQAVGVNSETLLMASKFIITNSSEIFAFVSPFPELRAWISWIINHIEHEHKKPLE